MRNLLGSARASSNLVAVDDFLSLLDCSLLNPRGRHRVRVVKELVLKANGLCPREFKSRRCRHAVGESPNWGVTCPFLVAGSGPMAQ